VHDWIDPRRRSVPSHPSIPPTLTRLFSDARSFVPSQPGKIYKRDDGVVVLHMYGKDVLAANNQGEVTLDADGDRGKNTFLGVHDALSRFGFKLSRPNPAAPEEWSVSDGKKFLKRYEDGMVIPAPKPPGPGRMLALLQTEVRAGRRVLSHTGPRTTASAR